MDDAPGPEVPFQKVGPGQSMRLVYQVLGSNGPISNPRGIRYMAPDGTSNEGMDLPVGSPLAAIDAAAFAGAAQLANLGLAVANVAISAATLVEVKKQTRMMREMQVLVRETAQNVDALLTTAERVDVNVAQVQLRYSLRYAVTAVSTGGEVDLLELRELAVKALSQFFESTGGRPSPGTHRELSLSPDLRALCEALLSVFWSARMSVLMRHNSACGGDPRLVVTDDGARSVLTATADATVRLAALRDLDELAALVPQNILGPLKLLSIGSDAQKALADRVDSIRAGLAGLPWHAEASSLLPIVEELDLVESGADPQQRISRMEDYLGVWAAHSDAGLLWSLTTELDLHGDGDYWSLLSARRLTDSVNANQEPVVSTRTAALSAGAGAPVAALTAAHAQTMTYAERQNTPGTGTRRLTE